MSWMQTLAGIESAPDVMSPITQRNGMWYAPDTFRAGNKWSSASINPEYAKSQGGVFTEKDFKVNQNQNMNPYQQTSYNKDSFVMPGGLTGGGKSATGEWAFNQDPTSWLSSGAGTTFNPGEGEDRWKTFAKDVGPALAIGLGGPLLGGMMAGAGSALQPIAATTGAGGGGTVAGGGGFGGAMGAGAAGGSAGGTAAGGGLLSGSIPSMAGSSTMGGAGIGAAGGTGFGAGGLTAAGAGGGAAAGGGGWFSGLLNNAGKQLSGIGSNMYNNPLTVAAGAGQGLLQYLQGQKLEDIAREAAARGNALDQPQRQGYQDLLSQYYNGGQDITKQPMVAANLEYARRQNEGQLAKQGLTGSGRALTSVGDYTNEVFQRNAMPYLDTLQGIAGFNQGPGYSGNLYGQYSGQASGANNQAFGSLFNGLTAPSPSNTQWWDHANYAQNQMTQIPGAGTYKRDT